MIKTKADKIVATLLSGVFTLTIGLATLFGILNVDNSTRAGGGGGGNPYNQPIIAAGFYYTLAIADGKLYSWGYNSYGNLGDGTTTQKTSPVRIGTATNWVTVSANEHSLAINSLGELWAWGQNQYGELGLGDTTNRTSPTKVGTKTNWVAVSAGGNMSLALNDVGELWAWGWNGFGNLGDGTTTTRYSPVKVINKSKWVDFSAGYESALAINDLGELWAWGNNWNGQLGVGDTSNRTSPTRVGTATNWVSISTGGSYHGGTILGYSFAINSLGELWGWGWNGHGNLGLGDTSTRTSPTRVGTRTDWAYVSPGNGYGTLALNNNGELFACGENTLGGVGDGTTTQRTSFVKIGTQTNWVGIARGYHHSIGVNDNGELFAWGHNGYGQLGLGDTTNRYAPQLVAGLTLGSATAVPNPVSGAFTVSAPSKTRVFPGDTYTFTVTRTHGTGDIGLQLNTPDTFHKNGTLELTSIDGNVLTYTVSNVLFSLTADDFSVTTHNVEKPDNGEGYTISTTMSSTILINGSYTFTITTTNGYGLPMVRFTSPNGKHSYTTTDYNTLTVTISNITGDIFASDFTTSVSKV